MCYDGEMHIARRRLSVLLETLQEMHGRLKPAALRFDMRGQSLLAEVSELEASGGLVNVNGALVGDTSEIGEVLMECGVWPSHVLAAFRRANWVPKLSDRVNVQ